MSSLDSDGNLLFGVLALQVDAITRSQFVDGCSLWVSQKERSLADVLSAQGWLSAADRADVERLVRRKLERHGGDARAGLAEVTGDVARQSLAGLDDPDVRRSLDGIPTAQPEGHILLSTMAVQAETRDRYTLTRLHARGGIGQVWLARDMNLGRDVALKELRPERASHPTIWSRFLEEARITGQLEHPGIVPVYELTKDAADQKPFYTMRFVRGRTLTEATHAYHKKLAEGNAGPLEMPALLNAFVGVCQAVAYAHSRGVIHRDLKGQNVVLGDYGEVMVLDWGLAKVIGRPDDAPETPTIVPGLEDALHDATLQGQALGTPAYMAPEQAAGRLDQIDQRTDVYGLGAILYEILTGRPPFIGAETHEVLRRVREEEPARPRGICTSAPAELEAVCLKALAKGPEDRYSTAQAMAREVQRFLSDEPVKAYREPLTRRAGRWARRHRPLVAGAAALLVTAVVTLTAGTVLLSRANARTEAQRLRAEKLRLSAEAGFLKARQAVDEYFTKVSESKLLNVPGLQPLRKELLESSRKYYQEFLLEHADDPSVRAEAAEAWYRVGFVTMYIDRGKEALDAFQKAADMYDGLARDHPDVERYAYKLAMSLNDLGNEQSALGLESEAYKSHERCLAIRHRIVRDHPDVPEYRKELCIGYLVWSERQYAAGLTSESLGSIEQARDIVERLVREHPEVADYRNRLSSCLRDIGLRKKDIGRPAEAMPLLLRSLELAEGLSREQPDVLDHKWSLIAAHQAIGWVHYRLSDRYEDALAAYLKAKAIAEKVARDNPDLMRARASVKYQEHELARILVRLGRLDEALPLYRSVLDFYENRIRGGLGGIWDQLELAYLHWEIGRLHRTAKREPEALVSLAKALAIFETLAEEQALDPYNRACVQALAAGLVGLGKADLSPEERASRGKYSDRAVATLRQAAAGGHQSPEMIASDIDFEAIRSDEKFRAFLAELKAHTPASGATASKTP